MFCKVIERLLLRRFDARAWARAYPTQPGFRSHNSTCVNAAVLHALLETRRVTHVAFLNFKARSTSSIMLFHALFIDVLCRRGCPARMRALIANLTCYNVRSRVVSNGEASDWFCRTRGVLPGPPFSPYLFIIFADRLLEELSRYTDVIPQSLFYAEDGTLLASARERYNGCSTSSQRGRFGTAWRST